MSRRSTKMRQGFTIVELLIVIVVIAILATITIVSYNGIASRSKAGAAQLSAKQGYTKITAYSIQNGDAYPADLNAAGLSSNTGGTYYEYTVDNTATPHTFCLTATVSAVSYNVSNTTSVPASGLCPGHTGGGAGVVIADGSSMQTITPANCPTTRTRAVDARDNHTYWVQKLADGKCWMLTNLAYAGSGASSYGDTVTLTNGTGGSKTYTVASYYIPPSGGNVTAEPTNPSTSTDGGATNPQYGYLYNWCAAMGGQATAACSNGTSPVTDPSISICPKGWRLPTGNGGEFAALNAAVNSGSTTSDAGLRASWLAQWGGRWVSGFINAGGYGYYWASSQNSGVEAYLLVVSNTYIGTSDYLDKGYGFAVRCVAN